MDYLIPFFLLTLVVYWAPAVALYPRILCKPHTLVLAPLVSACIMGALTYILLPLGLFTPLSVQVLSFFLLLIAFKRIYTLRQAEPFEILTTEVKRICVFVVLLLMPYMVKLGSTGFDSGDEIYSWNVWALDYVQGYVWPVFEARTIAPYPQLYPRFIAWCYQFLGNTQLQLPIKATLIWFPFSLLSSLFFLAPSWKKPEVFWGTAFTVLLVCMGTGLHRYFDDAYADPFFFSLTIGSLAMFVHRSRQSEPFISILMCLLAVGAAYTKQPGMIWLMFSLPCLLLLNRRDYHHALTLGIGLLSAGALWFAIEGSGFHNNTGVISASFQDRSVLDQLLYSLHKYFILNPTLGVLFGLSIWGAHQQKQLTQIFYLWLLPSLILWFIFGAYHLRLGVHVVFGMLVIVLASELSFNHFTRLIVAPLQWFQVQRRAVGIIGLILSVGFSVLQYHRSPLYTAEFTDYRLAGTVTLAKYFGDDAPRVYEQYFNQHHIKLWVSTDYMAGLFYLKAPLIAPKYEQYINKSIEESVVLLLAELKDSHANVAFTVGRLPVRGAIVSDVLLTAVRQYPELFTEVSTSTNRYGYRFFTVDQDALSAQSFIAE